MTYAKAKRFGAHQSSLQRGTIVAFVAPRRRQVALVGSAVGCICCHSEQTCDLCQSGCTRGNVYILRYADCAKSVKRFLRHSGIIMHCSAAVVQRTTCAAQCSADVTARLAKHATCTRQAGKLATRKTDCMQDATHNAQHARCKMRATVHRPASCTKKLWSMSKCVCVTACADEIHTNMLNLSAHAAPCTLHAPRCTLHRMHGISRVACHVLHRSVYCILCFAYCGLHVA